MRRAKPEAALLAAEQRLGVTFPAAYRDFVLDRRRYVIGVKRISFHSIERCDWLDDHKRAIAIGRSFTDGDDTLCFKLGRGSLSEAVHVWDGAKFKRIPDFSELVMRERTNPTLGTDDRTRLAERLGGAARRCSCGRELRVLQVCECGRIGARTDAPYALSVEEQAQARQQFPAIVRAAALVTALKQAGHTVPSGPTQLLATADLLEANAPARALLAAWKQTGMTITLDAKTLEAELGRRGVGVEREQGLVPRRRGGRRR
ncbi:MAG: SMI1/KNR4 family protein [Kofleriaceae bacterium]